MPARVNHVAIASDQYALNGRFYESLFGMKPSSKPRPARSVVLGDGYVGMNCIPRRDGRYSGLDHFGIEVEDLDDTIARIAKFDSSLSAVKRPPIRPFAAYSAHDPDTNIFDLSQKSMGFQKDVYAENDWVQPRSISHIALRTRHAERCAQFYSEVFGLAPLNRPKDDNFYLSDGRVTLMIIPWRDRRLLRAGSRAHGPGPYRVQGRKRGRRSNATWNSSSARTRICMGARWATVRKAKRG